MKYNDITLGQVEAVWNKLGGVDGVRRFLADELAVKVAVLLCKVATVSLIAIQKFVVNDNAKKKANVGWTNSEFDRLFGGKTEENVEATTFAVHRLEKASVDAPILAELGERAKTALAYLFELMEKQSKGEDGVLLTNGYANIIYAIGNDGNIWAVDACWHSGYRYWDVGARSVESPGRWGTGRQILSHDS